MCVYLRRRWSVPVAGEDFQRDPAAAVLEHLLQLGGVVAHVLPVHFLYDVAHVEEALPVDHAAVEDPRDHQVVLLHTKCHSLGGRREEEEDA